MVQVFIKRLSVIVETCHGTSIVKLFKCKNNVVSIINNKCALCSNMVSITIGRHPIYRYDTKINIGINIAIRVNPIKTPMRKPINGSFFLHGIKTL